MPQALMVDLGEMTVLDSVYVLFEKYSEFVYTIEVSENGEEWESFAVSSGENVFEVTHHGKADARYIRLVITGSSNGVWASVREMEVFAAESQEPAIQETVTQDANGARIEFRGGSLRMDYENYDKTSLRFGYKIQLPEGATLNSWSWQYTTTDPSSVLNAIGKNKTVNSDGSINANMVVTGIPKSYFVLVLTAKMKIEYTLSDGTVCTLEEDVFRSRSVNQIAENILVSPDATQVEKNYANHILQ